MQTLSLTDICNEFCQIHSSVAKTIVQPGSKYMGMVGAGLCPFIVVSTPVTISIFANPKQQNAIYRVKAQIHWKPTLQISDIPFKLINLKVIKLQFFCNFFLSPVSKINLVLYFMNFTRLPHFNCIHCIIQVRNVALLYIFVSICIQDSPESHTQTSIKQSSKEIIEQF